jgi:hypothetical protein
MTKMITANGFLFVGDQHICSKPPQKRNDPDYATAILGKLEQAIRIANENDLVVLLLGDLLDKSKELEESLKTLIIRLLKKAKHTPVGNVGNHDIHGFRLADGDSLKLIAEGGTLIVPTDSGPVGEFMLSGMRVGLGLTPYGQEIPREVRSLFPEAEGVVWLTHHDIAFNGAYPGSIVPFEIGGCGLVVNGHMHCYVPILPVGSTAWFNPGSLTRTKLDQINEEPAVWEFRPGEAEALKRHQIEFVADVFDLTGRLVPVAGSNGEEFEVGGEFADGLEAEMDTAAPKTADGVLLDEELTERFKREATPQAVMSAVMDLRRRVREDAEAPEV